MLEEMSWEFFQHTGSIDTFLEYVKIKDLKSSEKGTDSHGDNNKGNKGWGGE